MAYGTTDILCHNYPRLPDISVSLEAMQRKPIPIQINRSGANAKLSGSAKHPCGNLAPVGNKDGFECL
jgi:hypothetical protein